MGYFFAAIAELMPEVEEVVALGGGLRNNDDWLQILADVLGRPVTASAVKEASLRGAAVVVLERLGESPPPGVLGRVIEPRLDRADVYRAARDRWRRLYEAAIGRLN